MTQHKRVASITVGRRWRFAAALAVAVVTAYAAAVPFQGHAATGPEVSAPPGDVFSVGGCTAWAIAPDTIATATHCQLGAGVHAVSVSGKDVTTIDSTDVPGSQITVLRTRGSKLTPFRVAALDPGGRATVYGFGHSGGVLRKAQIGPVHSTDGARITWGIVGGDTVCHGDSGAPVVQGGAVVAALEDGDDARNGHCAGRETGTMATAPVWRWLQDHREVGQSTTSGGTSAFADNVQVLRYDPSGAPQFIDAIVEGADAWNSHVKNVRLERVPDGQAADITFFSDDQWPFADTDNRRIDIGMQAVNEGHYAPRIASHELGHILGLPDTPNERCEDIMAGGSAGLDCHSVTPSPAEAAQVDAAFSDAGTAKSAGPQTDMVAPRSETDRWGAPAGNPGKATG